MPKQTYTASEAAAALGISLDTLRRWDKAGRLRVERDRSNRRVVAATEIDRLRGDASGTGVGVFPGGGVGVATISDPASSARSSPVESFAVMRIGKCL